MTVWILLSGWLLSPAASGDHAAFLEAGGSAIMVLASSGDTVFTMDADPGERLSYHAFGNFRIFCISSERGLLETDMLTGETTVLETRRTGAPWVDSEGDLWYTLEGSLFRNGEEVNTSVPAFMVSVENGRAAYCDPEDNLRILDLTDGTERIVQRGYRFFGPLMLRSGDVVASTLSEGIAYVSPYGSMAFVSGASEPCWSDDYLGIFYSMPVDDGHTITGSDLWFARPGEDPMQLTLTPDVFEMSPSISGINLWYVDEATGKPGYLRADDLIP